MTLTAEGMQIGLFNFSYYGLIIVLAFVLSVIFAFRRAKVRKLDTRYLWMMALIVFGTAILGARIWYASFPPASAIRVGITPEYYRRSLLDFLAFWQGGFSLPGAVIGGLIGFGLYHLPRRLDMLQWLRAFAPVIPFATAIAVWGNFLTQENYGLPSQLPWAISIAPQYRVPGYTSLGMYHPLFLYQSLWALFTTILVVRYEKKNHSDRLTLPLTGSVMAFGFLLLETIRIDAKLGNASTMNMAFWAAVLLLSLMRLYFIRRNTRRTKL
ncbi:MAG: prolipoprotein diacylglyceryl transferase family protein [Anaerolineae bacterium]|jgi:phosphatidylglycerol:prolipoprotein diacylglycerol transferase|nr:prolipoprotein diacylglyceryl transferase family protein [Anaerolineae bacterium]